jgi:hypothetical protein
VTRLDLELLRVEQARLTVGRDAYRYKHWAFVGLLPGTTVGLVGDTTFMGCLDRVLDLRESSRRTVVLAVAWAQDCAKVNPREWTALLAGAHPAAVRLDFLGPLPLPLPALEHIPWSACNLQVAAA